MRIHNKQHSWNYENGIQNFFSKKSKMVSKTVLVHFYVYGPPCTDDILQQCINSVRKNIEQTHTPIKFQSIKWYSAVDSNYSMSKDLALETQYKSSSYEQFLLDLNIQYWNSCRQASHPSFQIPNNNYSPLFVVLSPYTEILHDFLQQIQMQNLISVPFHLIGDNISSQFPAIKLQDIKTDLLSNILNLSRDQWSVHVQQAVPAEKSETTVPSSPINNLAGQIFNLICVYPEPVSFQFISLKLNTPEKNIVDCVSKSDLFKVYPEKNSVTVAVMDLQNSIFRPTTPNLQRSLSMYAIKALNFCKSLK